MRVLISGAGVAGNALAFWLSKLGHDVTVVERFPSLRTSGLQVDLRGHGVEVMKRMGLEQAFRSKSAPELGMQLVDKSGKRRAFFPANKSAKGLQSFTSEFEIMRGDLCSLMYDATKHHTKYIFGTLVESFEEKGNSVEIRYADGKTGSFDLWVGADGLWSRTRRMMNGPGVPDTFTPLGDLYTGYFTIARPIQEGEEYVATSYIAPGRRGMMTRRHNEDTLQVYLGCKSGSNQLKAARGDTGAEKEILRDIFKGAGWKTEEFTKAMMDADDFYLEHMGIVKIKSWSRGRVALVGDAAYCPSANTGMGTTAGMVGAYILAGEISEHCGLSEGGDNKDGLATALKCYEQKFRPFMDQVTKGLVEGGDPWSRMPSSAFGISVMHSIVALVSFFRLDVVAKYVLREEIQNWELPKYEALLKD